MNVTDVARHFESHIEVIERVKEQLSSVVLECAVMLSNAFKNGNKVLVMGNGGSAADAQHLAAELVGRFVLERKALPAIALTTDSSVFTAVGNDYGFDEIFKRQVEALTQSGDVLIGISTSGNSKNVSAAMEAGRRLGAKTIGFLGRDGGVIHQLVDLNVTIPCHETARIQEAHAVIIHILCDLVEKTLFQSSFCDEN